MQKQSGNAFERKPKWQREGQAANQEKACKKEIDKTTAKVLQNSLKSIDTNILVDKATASLKPGAIVARLT